MNQPLLRALAMAVLIVLAITLRIAPAPYSTGSDIPQFAGFADTFLRHRFCFYSFAKGSDAMAEGWPYNWPYIYGPIWIYVLALLRLESHQPVKHYYIHNHYYVYVPENWIVSVKSVIIASDICVGLLILYVVSKWRGFKLGFIASAVYLLDPATIYVSGIYGMFDALVALFLIPSLLLYEVKHSISGALAGLAALTKQVALPALLPLITGSTIALKSKWKFLLYGLITGLALYSPLAMLCPHSLPDALRALFGYKQIYTYPTPISYSFNGISSLITYIHYHYGGNYLWVVKLWFVPYIILQSMALIYYLRLRDLFISAYLSYASFIATYWRVNYQYLVILAALSTISIFRLRDISSKFLAIISSIAMPALWPIAFPTSWWFHAHIENPNYFWIHLVNSLTLMIFNDKFYVSYSIILTSLLYLTIIRICLSSLKEVVPE